MLQNPTQNMGCCFTKGSYNQPKEVQTLWFTKFADDLSQQTSKHIVITGCTTGTGFVATNLAASKGCVVFMLNRPSERARAALSKIQAANPAAILYSVDCDLTSFSSVRVAAGRVGELAGDNGLDVLCCNAGVMALADQATTDGFDIQIQTNHLSHFLLQKLLFPLVKKAGGRIVNHSSIARHGKQLEEKYFGKNGGNLGGDGASMFLGGARWARYHQSKLAQPVFTAALKERMGEDSGVTVVTVAPGYAATDLQVTSHKSGGECSE